jgi:ATP-dependent DNA helicase RecQ
MAINTEGESLLSLIQRFWGYDSFRPIQADAMQALLDRRDSLTLLPTGGGKSLCYQVPALSLPGTAIVVSPLISLMKDQVDALERRGVPAAFINSGQSWSEKRHVAERMRRGELKLLYIAPERLVTDATLEFLSQQELSCLVVDEAHCITAWGHDFRPEYRELKRLKQSFPNLSIHAFTATASEQVRQDIIRQLDLQQPQVLVGDFDRPNLTYRVWRADSRAEQLLKVVEKYWGESGIIYCISRSEVERISSWLSLLGVAARPYHAGLTSHQRRENQEAFIRGRCDVIVATVAFGMGIDKPDVRYVIHSQLPQSIEHYQQESGRAGRDGRPSECILIHSPTDLRTWSRLIGDDRAKQRGLDELVRWCHTTQCRHRTLVEYFGQTYSASNCGACDVCLGETSSPSRLATRDRAPRSENDTVASQKRGMPMTAARAFPYFDAGESIDQVAARIGRARSTVSGYLDDYLRYKKRQHAQPWVDVATERRVTDVLMSQPSEKLKPIFETLGGEISYDTIRWVAVCHGNRQAEIPANDKTLCSIPSQG